MYKFCAEERQILGKRESRRLRNKFLLPASIYLEKGGKSFPVILRHKDFLYIQQDGFDVDKSIELEFNSDTISNIKVIFKEIQRHPYKNFILHIDFQEVA